jgi:hypothetical protein
MPQSGTAPSASWHRRHTPASAGSCRRAAETRYALVGLLLLVLQIVLSEIHATHEQPPTVIVQIDEKRIVREIEQHIDERLDRQDDQKTPDQERPAKRRAS